MITESNQHTDTSSIETLHAEHQLPVDTATTRPVAATFTVSDPHFFFWRQELAASWQWLAETLVRRQPRVALLAVPVFWQLGPAFYHTCRAAEVPVAVTDPRNLDVAELMATNSAVDLIVTTQQTAALLADRLGTKADAITWFIIASLREEPVLPLKQQVIEYHAFPGRPVGLVTDIQSGSFKINERYRYELNPEGECAITDLHDCSMPLTRFVLPGRFASGEDALTLTKVS